MASLTDLLTAGQNGVTAINSIAEQMPKTGSFLIGTLYAINTLSTAETQILSANSTRTSISLHNPSSLSLLIYPTAISTNISFTRPGGGFVLLPQDFMSISGNCGQEWRAQASAGSSIGLTVMTW